MQILLRSARIIDPQSTFNGLVRDVLIDNGLVRQIAESIDAPDGCQLVDKPNLHVSPGWVDMRVIPGVITFDRPYTGNARCAWTDL